jgi:hypothetical protein
LAVAATCLCVCVGCCCCCVFECARMFVHGDARIGSGNVPRTRSGSASKPNVMSDSTCQRASLVNAPACQRANRPRKRAPLNARRNICAGPLGRAVCGARPRACTGSNAERSIGRPSTAQHDWYCRTRSGKARMSLARAFARECARVRGQFSDTFVRACLKPRSDARAAERVAIRADHRCEQLLRNHASADSLVGGAPTHTPHGREGMRSGARRPQLVVRSSASLTSLSRRAHPVKKRTKAGSKPIRAV